MLSEEATIPTAHTIARTVTLRLLTIQEAIDVVTTNVKEKSETRTSMKEREEMQKNDKIAGGKSTNLSLGLGERARTSRTCAVTSRSKSHALPALPPLASVNAMPLVHATAAGTRYVCGYLTSSHYLTHLRKIICRRDSCR